jgi:NAD kinase
MVERWHRIGLIVNASAGAGADSAFRAARDALCSLGAEEVFTGPGELGEDAVAGWRGRIAIHDVGAAAGPGRTQHLAKFIAAQRPDALIVVGGDGTLADVAQVFIEQNCLLPILGIGSGSTNVGRLITCRVNEVWKLDPAKLETWNVDCLTARVNDELLGRAFNDVVIGHTVVGTIEGKLRDLDAAERSRGRLVAATPRSIATQESKVTRNSKQGASIVAQGESVGTVVAGFAEPTFFGKAVCGGICLASFTGLPAGCLVSNLPLVQVEIDAETLARTLPIVSSYVSLGENITVMVKKIQAGAFLCVDGNPVRQLGPSDRVVISINNKDAVRGVRFQKEQGPT